MKRLVLVAVFALLLVPVRAAEDFTGKWSGTFVGTAPDGSIMNEPIVANLKHKDTALTGTAGPSDERQWPIAEGGKVDGNKLTFDVQGNGPLIKFTLNFAEGSLKGDASAERDGQKMSAKIELTRAK
jgi:hypothetical protein